MAALAWWLGLRRCARRLDIIREVPTIEARDIPGLGAAMVEVKGVVRATEPLISDLARLPCVVFVSTVTEYWTTTRIARDSKGRTRTVTEHHSATRYSNEARVIFTVHDDSGSVTVRPDGASFDLLDGLELAGVDEPLPESPAGKITAQHFNGHLSYSEQVFPLEQQAYVIGEVSENHEIVAPRVVDRPFVVSYRSEESLVRRALWGKRVFAAVCAILFLAGFVFLASGFGWMDFDRSSWSDNRSPVDSSRFPRPDGR
ncbi:MAG TPA: GIDE domain-containing protein [Phycisphaerae bacterium]|nr:GIDE domain-containing protein [Phycisphaerae bacterium]